MNAFYYFSSNLNQSLGFSPNIQAANSFVEQFSPKGSSHYLEHFIQPQGFTDGAVLQLALVFLTPFVSLIKTRLDMNLPGAQFRSVLHSCLSLGSAPAWLWSVWRAAGRGMWLIGRRGLSACCLSEA